MTGLSVPAGDLDFPATSLVSLQRTGAPGRDTGLRWTARVPD